MNSGVVTESRFDSKSIFNQTNSVKKEITGKKIHQIAQLVLIKGVISSKIRSILLGLYQWGRSDRCSDRKDFVHQESKHVVCSDQENKVFCRYNHK